MPQFGRTADMNPEYALERLGGSLRALSALLVEWKQQTDIGEELGMLVETLAEEAQVISKKTVWLTTHPRESSKEPENT